jgi:predicted NBD/HSP70 family sugar kinase/biotin operon repressor
VTVTPTPRDRNQASILEAVLSSAPLTRGDLIELTGLSKATVSRAVEELRSAGFVVDGEVDEVSGRGRRSTNLDVPGTSGHVVGISFGVRTTCVLTTDLRGREIAHVLLPTVDHQEVRAAAAWLVDLMADARQPAEGPLRQVVVAVPGQLRDPQGLLGPAEGKRAFAGPDLHNALEPLIDAPVLLDSDANASLLGILAEDPALGSASLFSASSMLSFATCADHELVRGSSPAFGDLGALVSGVGNAPLERLMSTSGLLAFCRGRGLDLDRVEDLWLQPHDEGLRAEILDAFATAMTTAVSVVAVTLDPKSVYFVGRLQPLVHEVLPEVRARLDQILSAVPQVTAPPQVLGLSVARGAVSEGLRLTRDRLRQAVLGYRQDQPAARSTPAF